MKTMSEENANCYVGNKKNCQCHQQSWTFFCCSLGKENEKRVSDRERERA